MRNDADFTSRRNFVSKIGQAGLLASALLISPNAFADTFAAETDNISSKPKSAPKILDSAEIGVGDPTKYIGRAAMLKAALKSLPRDNAYPVQAWMQLMASIKNSDPKTQIRAINQFFNQVRYVSDGQGQDSWKMPVKFLCEGGDCEDYAIAKFVSLRLLGFHPDRVRMVFVENSISGIQHAVTVVNYQGQILVMDNMSADIKNSAQLTHYVPICSFDDQRLWMHWSKRQSKDAVASLQQRYGKQG